MRNPEEEGKKRERKGEKGGCGSSGKEGGKKEWKGGKRKGARGQSPRSRGELSGSPSLLDRETLSCFFTRDEKKKTHRSQPPRLATAVPDVTAEGKPGALYPLAARHGHQPSKGFRHFHGRVPQQPRKAGKKRWPSLGFSPAKAASASALLPTNAGSLLDGFPLFAMSNARRCHDVASEWKAVGQKKTRQSGFQRAGRRDSQLTSVSANFAPEAKTSNTQMTGVAQEALACLISSRPISGDPRDVRKAPRGKIGVH